MNPEKTGNNINESLRYFMAENKEAKKTMTEQKKQSVLEKLWLTYYNDTLYEKGLINEEERNKMRIRIKNRASSMER